jgi:hypothetical protein
MKELFDNPSPPLELYVKEPDGTLKITTAMACAHCRAVRHSEAAALRCCLQQKCADCGANVDQSAMRCNDCHEVRREGRAAEVADDGHPVFDDSRGEYYDSLDAYLDEVPPENRSEFVYACRAHEYPGINVDAVLENIQEAYHEEADYTVVDRLELVDFIDAWNAKQPKIEGWDGDYSRKIRVPAEPPKESAP